MQDMGKGYYPLLAVAALALGGCAENQGAGDQSLVEFPPSLQPVGSGIPNAEGSCRALGETEAIAKWAAEFEDLAGCPSKQEADDLGGKVVAIVDDFFIVALGGGRDENADPSEAANAAASAVDME